MKLADLGLNENRGGGALVVTGTLIKSEYWDFTDPDTKKYKEGYTWQLAFYGGVLKVATEEGDPLRDVGVGEDVALRLSIGSPRGNPQQIGRAILLDPKTLQPKSTPPQ